MSASVIETHDLTVYYGRQRGIQDVDLSVQEGEVFGFLGPNGAGKTTTQRVLLDIIRPTHGLALILGADCQREGAAIREQVGYLPGELSMYQGMRADKFLDLMGSLRSSPPDTGYLQSLYERLDLDPSKLIKQYSRGNRQKVGVIAAFMCKPKLLILDEPTSGLDPLVQQAVLTLVREARADGRTVFFSSHNLPEVQSVCDRVGIIRDGRLVRTERVETLTAQQFVRLNITFQHLPDEDTLHVDGVEIVHRTDNAVMLQVRKNLDKLMNRAAGLGIVHIETLPVTLEEIFLEFYGHGGEGGNGA